MEGLYLNFVQLVQIYLNLILTSILWCMWYRMVLICERTVNGDNNYTGIVSNDSEHIGIYLSLSLTTFQP